VDVCDSWLCVRVKRPKSRSCLVYDLVQPGPGEGLVGSRRRKKKISLRQLGPLRGSSSPFQHFEPARVKPN